MIKPNKSVRTKIILVLAIILSFGWLVAFNILNLSLESIYDEIEQRQIINTKLSIEQVLLGEKSDLSSRVKDWAIWDDAYNFIIKKNISFVQSNINNEILANYKIDNLVFTDINHKTIYLISTENKEKVIQDNAEKKSEQNTAIDLISANEVYYTIVKIQSNFYALAVSKVTPTENPDSKFNGYLYFYQKLNDAFFIETGTVSGAILNLNLNIKEQSKIVKESDSIIFNYPLKNSFDEVEVLLRVKIGREYASLFNKLRVTIVWVSLLFAIFFFVVIYLILNKVVIRPLKKIEKQTNAIAKGENNINRIDMVFSGDEFISLAKSINRMLDEREKMQREIRHKTQLVGLGELASGIAHEINNPLTVSLLSLDKLQKRYSDKIQENPDIEKLIAKIYANTRRISLIVSGMKSLSKNVDPSERALIDMTKLVNETIELYRERVRDNDIQLNTSLGESNTYLSFVNETQISQVLVNLLNNAIDAVSGNIDRRIFIRISSDDRLMYIEVGDNGPGVPDNIQDKVMQPFFTTKGSQKGTGLGLSISNEIIEHHNGKLSFTRISKDAEIYTVFKIELKAQKDVFSTGVNF